MLVKARKPFALSIVAAGVAMLAVSAQAADISGAGSTFVYPILSKWADAYKTKTSIGINYQSIGSGGGIQQIKSKTVDFGASDAPLAPEDLSKSGLLQFPVVIGGDVPVVNIPGIGPGQLKLTGPILADIFLGKITKWNDKAITEINSGLSLPSQAIAVVHRSDGSGTTYIWVHYLAKMSQEWKDKVGVNTAVEWPTGLGGKGNEGVAALTSRTPGAIGYVEYAYAKQNKMAFVQVKNQAGNFVAPNKETFQAAAANADWTKSKDFDLMLTDQPGAQSWPVTGSTWVIMYKQPSNPEASKTALTFFDWAFKNGDAMADELDYVAMPANVKTLIENAWKDIKGGDGAALWSASIQ